LSCDIQGCLYRAGGSTVALVTDPAAVAEECWSADVLVSTVPVRGRCPSPKVVIDRFDLWRDGAHALWLENGGIRFESANGERGHRPWVLRPKPRQAADDTDQ
jgi:competence protein ComEC